MDIPKLPSHLQFILDAEYPRFSDVEIARRQKALTKVMQAHGLEHCIVYGSNRSGSAVQWLTRWPVTAEAAVVFTPGKRDRMFVHYFNHLPLARRLASETDVEWGGESTFSNVVKELEARGAKQNTVGVLGPLGFEGHALLSQSFGALKSIGRDYVELRRIKSAEEIDWFRIGAWMSDLGMAALRDRARPGMTERQLANEIERAYVGYGGSTVIHFIGTTPMNNPGVPAPLQFASNRKLQKGDVVFAEISASFFEHSGQVLRSYAVGEPPNQLYRDLHAAADACFDKVTGVLRAGARVRDVIEATKVVEDAGFTTIDDVVHGYGGGYLPPVIGSTTRPNPCDPEETFAAGQLVVVQPNVVTKDRKAGVQTGEMLMITEAGVSRMHQLERAFKRIA